MPAPPSFKFQVYISRRMTANTPRRPYAFPSVGYQRRLDSSDRARRPCVVWDSCIHCLQVLPRSAPVAYPAPAVGLHPVARLCRPPLPASSSSLFSVLFIKIFLHVGESQRREVPAVQNHLSRPFRAPPRLEWGGWAGERRGAAGGWDCGRTGH